MQPAYRYRAALVRSIDGDTYVLDVDLGLTVHVRATVRLRGWDCQELTTPEGVRAREAATQLLGSQPVIVETYKDKQSFARWVADIWLVHGTEAEHLGDRLAALGLAVRSGA